MSEGMKVSLILLVIGTLETFRLGDCLPTNRMKQKRSIFDIIPETIGISQLQNKPRYNESKYKLKIKFRRKNAKQLSIKEDYNKSNKQLKKNMRELVQTLKYRSLLTWI